MRIDKIVVEDHGRDRTIFLGNTIPHEHQNRLQLEVFRRVVDASGKNGPRSTRSWASCDASDAGAGRPAVG